MIQKMIHMIKCMCETFICNHVNFLRGIGEFEDIRHTDDSIWCDACYPKLYSDLQHMFQNYGLNVVNCDPNMVQSIFDHGDDYIDRLIENCLVMIRPVIGSHGVYIGSPDGLIIVRTNTVDVFQDLFG